MEAQLACSERGDGQAVILLHGLFGNRDNVNGIARFLAERCRVYALDLPDHGSSPWLAEGSLRAYAASLLAWMNLKGIGSAAFLGHSLGGKVVMELALLHPERVRALVVADIAPVAYEHRHTEVFAGLNALDLGRVGSRREADAVLSQWVPEAAVRSFLLKNLQKGPDGLAWRLNLSGIQRAYPELIAANAEARFEGPALFLKAEHSDYIAEQHWPAIRTRFPHTDFKVVGNTGHWLHAERPELLARMVLRFFSSVL